MANSYKPSYRRKKAVMSTSVKVIIILLIVLVLTLSAFLIKIAIEKALDPGIVYPPDETDTYAPLTDDTDTGKTDIPHRASEIIKPEGGQLLQHG